MLSQKDNFLKLFYFRLLDICHGQRMEMGREMNLFLVFEHVDQDLNLYIEKCPPPGMHDFYVCFEIETLTLYVSKPGKQHK